MAVQNTRTTQESLAAGIDSATLDGGRTHLTGSELEALGAAITGSLVAPGDSGWTDALVTWNGMAAKTPALVVQPLSASDVAATVRFASDRRLLLSIKGGGHHIAGIALAEGGLVLDMSRMREVSVDPDKRLAHVGPGCQLKDVDRATQRHGLATVLGFISEVGVAGLTLGGGLGYLTRRFGWTVDNLEAAEVVTADGEIRAADRRENADLFWALRGGTGNFGVVTRFTFRLHEVGPLVHGGLIAWPFERADEILEAYRSITSAAAADLAVWLVMLHAPPAPFVPAAWQHQRVCGMCVCYTGDRRAAAQALEPIRALGDPVFDLLQERPYAEVQSYLDATEPKGAHYYWKTEYVSDLTGPLLSTLRARFQSSLGPEVDIGILHLAGALNAHASDDGAVGNRDARYVVGLKGMWEPGDPNAERYRQWIRESWEAVRPYSTGASYINFQTDDEDEGRVRASYGANFTRLNAIKKQYDPQNLFRVNRNIRVA